MNTTMIGVTIGCGPKFFELAQSASRTVERCCGLETVILTDRHLGLSGLQQPHLLKYRIFEFVDSDSIMFFDADTAFVRSWDPRIYADRQEVVCVRGKHWIVRKDLDTTGVPAHEYFNSGLLILNRNHHRQWLELSERIHKKIPGRFKDQSTLNFARLALHIPVHFIHRRFNSVGFERVTTHGGLPYCVIHATGNHKNELPTVIAESLEPNADCPYSIDLQLESSLAGTTWLFEQSGHLIRKLELLEGGTIGIGSMPYERFWWAVKTKEGAATLLFEAQGRITARMQPEGSGWFGHSDFMGFDVSLSPLPART